MMRFLVGLALGIALVPVVVLVYLMSGRAPAAVSDSPMPFERTIARQALHTRIAKEMPGNAPVEANEATYLAGAHIYKDDCAMCHGLPNQPTPAIARDMFPHVPQLFVKKGVTDDPPGETYWKARNGIRLSGMPAFRRSLSDTQLWQVSLLLANADKLPPSVKQELSATPPPVEGPQK